MARFGFVGLPRGVDVQPDDGFGTLLPFETQVRMCLILRSSCGGPVCPEHVLPRPPSEMPVPITYHNMRCA